MYQDEPIKCKCEECGKEFNKGDQGDNEKLCLRCEYILLIEDQEDCE